MDPIRVSSKLLRVLLFEAYTLLGSYPYEAVHRRRKAMRIAPCVLAISTLIGVVSTAGTAVLDAADDLRLVEAVQRQDRTAIRTLLQQRANVPGVNVRQPDGATAIAWAAHWDDLETAELLLRAGADVNVANDLGIAPLSLACKNGSASMVEKLLAAGANPNAASSTGETPLITAARTGNPNVVKALLARGAEVNTTRTALKQTPLMYASAEGHADVVRVLVGAGADVRARSTGGFTPLLFAARRGDVNSARILLDAGVSANEAAADGNTALVVAAASGREDVALLLLERGADPNAAGAGYTALHAAVPKDLQRLVASLLKHRADPNLRLRNAPANLFGPARGAGSEVTPVRMTEPSGGRASGQNVAGGGAQRPQGRGMAAGGLSGATAFWLAARNVNVPLMRALVEAGADPALTSDSGATPMMVAAGLTQVQGPRARRGDVSQFYSNWGPADSLESVKYLIALGADVNAANPSGQTALHGAAYMGADAVVRVLVQSGARLNAQDAQGQTPFRLAEGHLNVAGQGVTEWPTTAALLRTLGADTSLGVDGRTMLRRYGKPAEPQGN
jgi:ankyrin repeat protein